MLISEEDRDGENTNGNGKGGIGTQPKVFLRVGPVSSSHHRGVMRKKAVDSV